MQSHDAALLCEAAVRAQALQCGRSMRCRFSSAAAESTAELMDEGTAMASKERASALMPLSMMRYLDAAECTCRLLLLGWQDQRCGGVLETTSR